MNLHLRYQNLKHQRYVIKKKPQWPAQQKSEKKTPRSAQNQPKVAKSENCSLENNWGEPEIVENSGK